MPNFAYEALNQEKNSIRGIVQAENKLAAAARLKALHLQVLTLREMKAWRMFLASLFRIKTENIAFFTRQMATMLREGIPLMRCLDITSRNGEDSRLESLLLLVREHIRAGEPLSQALSRYPHAFDAVYQQLVKTGELVGQMPSVMDKLAAHLEKEVRLKRQVQSALTYPLFVFAGCVILALMLVGYIFPKFISLFEGMQIQMPLPTLVLKTAVDLFASPPFLSGLAIVLAAGGYFLNQYFKTPVGRRHFDAWMLTLPLVGPINRKVAVARFCHTLAVLQGAGISITQSLDAVGKVTGNELINDAIGQVQEAVKYGSMVSVPLQESGIFPRMVTDMIHVGEQSGALSSMLQKIASFLEFDIENALITFTKLLEPMLVGVMGGIVGFVVLAIFLPIYRLMASFR